MAAALSNSARKMFRWSDRDGIVSIAAIVAERLFGLKHEILCWDDETSGDVGRDSKEK